MNKEELEILIDKAVFGTLTKGEKEQLDIYIINKPTTKLEIQMRTDISKGLEYNVDERLKIVLNQIHDEEIKGSKRKIFVKKFSLAVFCVVLIFFSYSLYNTFTKVSPAEIKTSSELYANYYKPFVPSFETRSGDQLQEETYQKFIALYRAKEYQNSLNIINPYLDNADNNTLLLAGISAMEINEYQESQKYFDRIIDSADYYFADHAKWYKGLLLIKMKRIDDAKSILMELAKEQKADHHNESVSLLKEI